MFSAEYGAASGPVVNVLSKSGTNELHGRLSTYIRNDQLDARQYFATTRAPFNPQWYVGRRRVWCREATDAPKRA